MKDPYRIGKICETLANVWKDNPELRLCQLISIAGFNVGKSGDLFYVSDEDILRGLESIGE